MYITIGLISHPPYNSCDRRETSSCFLPPAPGCVEVAQEHRGRRSEVCGDEMNTMISVLSWRTASRSYYITTCTIYTVYTYSVCIYIMKDPHQSNNKLFQLLRSGKRLRSHAARTERLTFRFFVFSDSSNSSCLQHSFAHSAEHRHFSMHCMCIWQINITVPRRQVAMQAGLREAVGVPLSLAERVSSLWDPLLQLVLQGNISCLSDAQVRLGPLTPRLTQSDCGFWIWIWNPDGRLYIINLHS